MKPIICGVCATTLTPFCYHSLMVQSGTATLPHLLSDRALAFSLGAALGWMNRSVALPEKDYATHLRALPWRASVLRVEGEPRLLPPILRRLNLDAEAGFKKDLREAADRGNYKDYFYTQEVPEGQTFSGALFGYDPFTEYQRNQIVLRVGLHRNGLVKLERAEVKEVCLNAHTAGLYFKQEIPVARYVLHSLQLSPPMPVKDALEKVMQWL